MTRLVLWRLFQYKGDIRTTQSRGSNVPLSKLQTIYFGERVLKSNAPTISPDQCHLASDVGKKYWTLAPVQTANSVSVPPSPSRTAMASHQERNTTRRMGWTPENCSVTEQRTRSVHGTSGQLFGRRHAAVVLAVITFAHFLIACSGDCPETPSR
eukprot:2220432-Rhodomonas_salina.1